MRTYFEFTGLNLEGCKKKIKEFNDKFEQEQHTNFILSEKELRLLNGAIEVLADATNYYTVKIEPQQIDIITEKLFTWPNEFKLPVIDIFRAFCAHFQINLAFKGLDSGLAIIQKLNFLMLSEISDNLRNLILKSYCNLFRLDISRSGLVRNAELIWNPIKKCQSSTNSNIRTTLANLFINLSIDLNERAKLLSSEYLTQVAQLALESLKQETNPENILKYLVALGNISLGSPDISRPVVSKLILSGFQPLATNDQIQGCLNSLQ